MLTDCRTPAALRRIGVKRLTTWLERRKVRSADTVAAKAVEAAPSRITALPTEKRAAQLVRQAPYEMPLHPPCGGGKRWP